MRPATVLTTCVALSSALPLASLAATVFTVDPTRSSIALTPTTLNLNTGQYLTITRQVDPSDPSIDSFVTSYSGSIVADITPATIQILSPSQINADEINAWRPGTDYSNYPGDLNSPNGYVNTAAPAAYGSVTDLSPLGTVLGQGGMSANATRNLKLALVDPSPRSLTGGAFDETNIQTSFVWDTALPEAPPLVYYSSGGAPPTTRIDTVTNGLTDTLETPAAASLVVASDVQTLTIPVKFRITYLVNFLLISNTYEGNIVATAPVPEPGAAACLIAGTLFLRRRRG